MKMGWTMSPKIRASISTALMLFAAGPIAGATDFSSHDYAVGHMPILIVVHDFNHDGKSDVAVLNNGSGDVSILLGNGDGTFQTAKTFSVAGAIPFSFSVADINGDGKLDLAIGLPTTTGSCTGSAVNILFGNGDGTFQPAVQAISVPSNDVLLTGGDVNGDGKSDIVLERIQTDSACSPPPGFSVFLGNGDGSFQAEQDIAGPPFDFNGDGIPDLTDDYGQLNVFLGQGNGKYNPLTSGPEGNSGYLSVGDFNNDHIQDQASVVAVHSGGLFSKTYIYFVGVTLGNGDGTFQPQMTFPPGGYLSFPGGGNQITWIAPADFNEDGKLDVAFINSGTAALSVLLGKGDGTLPTLITYNPGSGENSFVVADVNSDGRPDLITANLNDDTISVVLNSFPTTGADLAVQLTATPEPVSITQNLTYTLSLQNLGPQDATNVVVTDSLPPTVTFGSVTIDHGSCTEAKLVVVCDIPTLVSGDTALATITVTPDSTGTISSAATASATESDTNSANNSVVHGTQVDPLFTLTVTRLGGGTGTVSGGGGVSCGTVCTVSLPTGTPINLQVTPAAGSGFGGWGGACSQNFTAPGCDLTMSANQTVTAEFDILPNFTFFVNSQSLSVQAGQSATDSLGIYPEGNSFPDPVALACTVEGAVTALAPTCTISPSSVMLPDSSGATATLTINTTGPSAVVRPMRALFYALLLFCSALILIPSGTQHRLKHIRAAAGSAALITAMVFQFGCGGGSSQHGNGGSPAGTYSVAVTATSGAIQHATSISLTVN
jgi:uncharacterized repeat protein (TIGR01451 family)